MGNACRTAVQPHYRFCEEIRAARSENWTLQYPSDPRLNVWLKGLRMGELPPRLNQLSRQVGACERTISRIFIRDTGMNYQDWRQQFRLLKAMEMLADGCHISQSRNIWSLSATVLLLLSSINIPAQHRAVIRAI